MSRIVLIVLVVGLLLLGGGALLLGAFPPDPKIHGIEKVLPNDTFKSH